MTVRTTAGSTLGVVNSVPATLDAAGFGALTYTTVGEVTDLGNLGKTYTTVNHSPVGSRKVQKLRGSYNNGTMTVKMGRDFTDAGQIALATARDSDTPASYVITTQSGHKMYFQALVGSFVTDLSTVDTITGGTLALEIYSDIVEV